MSEYKLKTGKVDKTVMGAYKYQFVTLPLSKLNNQIVV